MSAMNGDAAMSVKGVRGVKVML
jgi:hypothetical protein